MAVVGAGMAGLVAARELHRRGVRGREDFAVTASVDQAVLGGIDAHMADDACPRPGEKPAPKDHCPDGRITEKGRGAAAGGVRGGPALIDVVR